MSDLVSRQPIDTAPKDGTMVLLFVDYSGEDDDHYLFEAEPEALLPTLGFNSFEHDGEDVWQFAGWDWSHDCFTNGIGTPVLWQPLPGAPERDS